MGIFLKKIICLRDIKFVPVMFSVTKGDKNATSCSDAGTDEPQINPFTIICDTFYGFPNGKLLDNF